MDIHNMNVYIVNTEYTDGKFEINAVFQNKEKAERFVEFMKSNQKMFPESQIKNIKTNNFIVM